VGEADAAFSTAFQRQFCTALVACRELLPCTRRALTSTRAAAPATRSDCFWPRFATSATYSRSACTRQLRGLAEQVERLGVSGGVGADLKPFAAHSSGPMRFAN
jgi:hypothetical protein